MNGQRSAGSYCLLPRSGAVSTLVVQPSCCPLHPCSAASGRASCIHNGRWRMQQSSMETASAAPQVRHVAPGEGRAVWVVGDTYTFKATGAETDGRLVVWEALIPPGAGPPPHLHHTQDEAYYVLEGELEVRDGDTIFTGEAGAFVFIPRGAVHCFRNAGTTPSRMLLWMAPAGFEEFLFAVGQPARPGEQAPPLGTEEMARTIALAPAYGMELRLPEAPPAPAR